METLPITQEGELGLALSAAFNDWMVDRWLDRDQRFLGAITIPAEDGERAAREIARCAAERRFAKVMIAVATREPLGAPRYWPIFEAAEEAGLPITMHVGGFGASTPSGAGWASFHVEAHTNWALPYPVQVVSLVSSGVFDRFPKLQFVLEEGSLGWMPSLMWRMDRMWRTLGDRLPQLPEPPSAVIRRHFWFTTQPLDEPENPAHLVETFDMIGMSDRILFASDYPHHDFDAPDRVLPASLVGSDFRRMVMSGNATGLLARSLGTRAGDGAGLSD
jgi:predicted TIM-barrel fold metal-dependent hydrolase